MNTINALNFSAHTMYLRELTGDSYSVMAEWNAGLQWGGEDDEVEMAEFNAALRIYNADVRAYEASYLQDAILQKMADRTIKSPKDEYIETLRLDLDACYDRFLLTDCEADQERLNLARAEYKRVVKKFYPNTVFASDCESIVPIYVVQNVEFTPACDHCGDIAPHYDCRMYTPPCDTCGYANPCPDHCPEGWDDIPF